MVTPLPGVTGEHRLKNSCRNDPAAGLGPGEVAGAPAPQQDKAASVQSRINMGQALGRTLEPKRHGQLGQTTRWQAQTAGSPFVSGRAPAPVDQVLSALADGAWVSRSWGQHCPRLNPRWLAMSDRRTVRFQVVSSSPESLLCSGRHSQSNNTSCLGGLAERDAWHAVISLRWEERGDSTNSPCSSPSR